MEHARTRQLEVNSNGQSLWLVRKHDSSMWWLELREEDGSIASSGLANGQRMDDYFSALRCAEVGLGWFAPENREAC